MKLLLKSGADPTVERPWMLAKNLGFEHIAKLLPPSFDEAFLIQILKSLHYKLTSKGICLGFAHMAKHAIQTRQVNVLNQRLLTLFNLYYDAENKVLAELGLKRPFDRNDKHYAAVTERVQPKLVQAIEALHHSSHPQERQQYTDILAFCDGIFLYREHPNFSSLYERKTYLYCNSAAQQTLKLLMPVKNPMEYRGEFTGVYSLDELKAYLNILSSKIEKLNFSQPVSFVLSTTEHALTIGYDTYNHSWVYADSPNMPLLTTDNAEIISKKINHSFSNNEFTIFKTSLYAATSDRKKMSALMHALLKKDEWNKIHEVTYDKIKIKSGKEDTYTWSTIASGNELKRIQQMQNQHANVLIKPFIRYGLIFQNYQRFLANKTMGKYDIELDNDVPIPVYQRIK